MSVTIRVSANSRVLRSFTICFLAVLDRETKNFAFVVDGTLHPVTLSAAEDNHLIEVPVITRARPSLSQVGRDQATKLQKTTTQRFVGHIDSALRKQLLNVPKGKREPGIGPDGMLDNIGKETMSFIGDQRQATW